MRTALVRVLVIALAVFCFGCSGNKTIAADVNSCEMTAHFIYVGQGDSTLLEFPCGAILIDAGFQDGEKPDHLISYLKSFFDKRPDLNRTLESVIITHGHEDHTSALKEVCDNFTVKRYVDNGNTGGDGPSWLKKIADANGIILRDVNNDEITANGNKKGVTDGIIDPINCEGCDPKIVILWSRPSELRGEYKTNLNEQSLVIRVDFGKASFLFTGDAEKKETYAMLNYYDGIVDEGEEPPAILDVNVYHVGHHGSQNGTTLELLKAMTPTIAVISVGRSDYKKGSKTAWSYGLPRIETLKLLNDSNNIRETRSPSVTIEAAEGKEKCVPYTLTQRIYTTAKDGDIKIQAEWDGSFTVTGNN